VADAAEGVKVYETNQSEEEQIRIGNKVQRLKQLRLRDQLGRLFNRAVYWRQSYQSYFDIYWKRYSQVYD
jgi:hypothetical protein